MRAWAHLRWKDGNRFFFFMSIYFVQISDTKVRGAVDTNRTRLYTNPTIALLFYWVQWIGQDEKYYVITFTLRTLPIYQTGFSDDRILAVYPDQNSFLWMPIYHGLIRFHPEHWTLYTFTKKEGLPNNEFNLYSHHQQAVELQKLNQIKTTLITNIAHEFKTPLTMISGALQLLRKNSTPTRSAGSKPSKATAPGWLSSLISWWRSTSKKKHYWWQLFHCVRSRIPPRLCLPQLLLQGIHQALWPPTFFIFHRLTCISSK